jgi:hypothetical protein
MLPLSIDTDFSFEKYYFQCFIFALKMLTLSTISLPFYFISIEKRVEGV